MISTCDIPSLLNIEAIVEKFVQSNSSLATATILPQDPMIILFVSGILAVAMNHLSKTLSIEGLSKLLTGALGEVAF